MSDLLAEFKDAWSLVIRHPVQWGDMDAFGHVNNVMYFRYFETARIAYLRALGLDLTGGTGTVVADSYARYRRPLYYPDTIRLGVRISEMHRSGCLQEYAVFSNEQNAVTTTGSARIVLLDQKTGSRQEWPDAWWKAVETLEGRTLSLSPGPDHSKPKED